MLIAILVIALTFLLSTGSIALNRNTNNANAAPPPGWTLIYANCCPISLHTVNVPSAATLVEIDVYWVHRQTSLEGTFSLMLQPEDNVWESFSDHEGFLSGAGATTLVQIKLLGNTLYVIYQGTEGSWAPLGIAIRVFQ